MLKSFNFSLDLEKQLYDPITINNIINQMDFDVVEFIFDINQDDAPINLTDITLQIAILKPSGLTVFQDCEIIDPVLGTARVFLNNQAYIEYGVYKAELILRQNEDIAVTCPFYFSSKEAILNDETIESTNDWSALQEALFAYDKKPLLIDGVPITIPEYIGQMAFDTTGLRAFIANGLTAESWQLLAAGEGGGGGLVYWNDILGKPLTFAPSAHGHIIAEISGLQAALDSKVDEGTIQPAEPTEWDDILNKPLTFAPAAHTHDFGTITGKPATYPPDSHTHTFDSITGKPATYPATAHTHDFTTGITGKPATYPATAHTHTIADVSGLTAELDSKLEAIPPEYLTESEGDLRYELKGEGTGGQPSTGTTDPSGAPLYIGQIYINTTTKEAFIANSMAGDWQTISADELGGGAGSVDWTAITNKPNTFAPSAHTHLWADITDKPTTFAPSAHLHEIADVSGLSTALNGKVDDEELAGYSPTGHTHTFASITDKPAAYPAEAHSHAIADVTGLQTALDGKVDDAELTGYAPATHTHDFNTGITGKPATYPPPLMSGSVIGGALVGNGLAMSTNYLTVKRGLGIGLAGDNSIEINRTAVDTWYASLTHSHAFADITGKPATYPATAHTHLWADITDKPTTFTPAVHTHLWADITDKPTTFAPSAHSHAIADVTGLQGALDGKVDDTQLNGITGFWKGTQADYDLLTPDANTLYFISG